MTHEVEINGLSYDSSYEYRVTMDLGDGATQSFDATFDTRLEAGDMSEFTFVTYGDSTNYRSIEPFIEVQNRITELDPAFTLMVGDNEQNDGRYWEYDARFTEFVPLDSSSEVPRPENDTTLDWIASNIDYPNYGNHDIRALRDHGQNTYFDSYSVPIPVGGVTAPASIPDGTLPELHYSFDYGMVHFVQFDSNQLDSLEGMQAAIDWMRADIAATDAQWVIVNGHHPIGGGPSKSEGPEDLYWKLLVPAMNEMGVDLFLTGHSHTYSVTSPLVGVYDDLPVFVDDNDNIYESSDGVVQVVNGSGGTPLRSGSHSGYSYVEAGFSTTSDPSSEFGVTQIHVSENALTVEYVASSDGSILHSFQVVNDGSGLGGQQDTTTRIFEEGERGYTGVQDTFIDSDDPDENNGEAAEVEIDEFSDGGEFALVRFDDLFGETGSQLANDANIVSARLEFTFTNGGDSFGIHRMLTDWDEASTWNSLVDGVATDGVEAAIDPTLVTGTTGDSSRSGTVLSYDVTADVQDWQNGSANFGWLVAPGGSDGVDWASSETGNGPRLIVELEKDVDTNVAATAVDDVATVMEDSNVTIDVLANDIDPDDHVLLIDSVSEATNGTVHIFGDSIIYTPNADFHGQDSFTYSMTDGFGETSEATVSVTVEGTPELSSLRFQEGVNGYSGTVDTSLFASSADDDSSEDSELEIDSSSEKHTLIRFEDIFGNEDGQIAPGSDIVSAQLVFDVTSSGDEITLHEMLGTWEETASWSSLVDGISADGVEAAETPVTTSGGSVGTGTLELDVTDSILKWLDDPSSNNGWAILPTDSDGVDLISSEGSNVAARPELVVNFAVPNADPVAVDDAAETLLGEAATIDVLGNDTDADGDLLAVTEANAVNGSVTLNVDGTIGYTPNEGFSGTDTIDYVVSDGNGGSDSAQVSVDVVDPFLGTVDIDFGKHGYFGRTAADISVTDADGAVQSDYQKLNWFSNKIILDAADLKITSSGPGYDSVSAIKGGLGVSSRADKFLSGDRLDIDRKEKLNIKLMDDDEVATRLVLDFAEQEGDVQLVFFNDGERVAKDTYSYDNGMLELTDLAFDKVRISGTGEDDVRITGIEYDLYDENSLFEANVVDSFEFV